MSYLKIIIISVEIHVKKNAFKNLEQNKLNPASLNNRYIFTIILFCGIVNGLLKSKLKKIIMFN